MATHHLPANPDTCQWGYFDASRGPVISVASGDSVVIDTVTGSPDMVPAGSAMHVPPELAVIHKAVQPQGPHMLTGPVYIEGAKPGSVLEIQIEDVQLYQDWGFNIIIPTMGTLPYDFDAKRQVIIPLDRDRGVAHLSWGLELPLKPFFGVMGLAPPPTWGRLSSIQPQAFGGNLDNKELVAGATLYLPVFADGGLFSCGDGHGAQGDGEVCITAIETALKGRFRFIVRDDLHLARPRAETPTHYITMGLDPDLDNCAVTALREMIALLGERANLSREDAYMLCSLAGDLHVTQTVNGNKGVHMMMSKSLVH